MIRAIAILLLLAGCVEKPQPKPQPPTLTGYIRECGASWLCPDDPACSEMSAEDHKLLCEARW